MPPFHSFINVEKNQYQGDADTMIYFDFSISYCFIYFGNPAFPASALVLWNYLPLEIRSIPFVSFKSALKTSLLSPSFF